MSVRAAHFLYMDVYVDNMFLIRLTCATDKDCSLTSGYVCHIFAVLARSEFCMEQRYKAIEVFHHLDTNSGVCMRQMHGYFGHNPSVLW